MSTPSRRRLMRDLNRLNSEINNGFTAQPRPDNIMIWDAVIFGPKGTFYEDGTFPLVLNFDETYPVNPPKCRFLTPMVHPNIFDSGNICLDILKECWSPAYDVAALLTSIQSLLPEGETKYDYDPEYKARVRESVVASWKYKLKEGSGK